MDWNLEIRRRNAHYLTENLKDLDFLRTAYEAPYVKHGFYKYYCTLNLDKLKVDRDQFVKAVKAEGVPIGIGTSAENYLEEVFQRQVGYADTGCPFKCPWYKGGVDYSKVNCPNARKIGQEAFVLLVHPTIELADLDDVIMAIKKVGEFYHK